MTTKRVPTQKRGRSGNPAKANGPAVPGGELPEMVDMSQYSEDVQDTLAEKMFYRNMAQLPVMLAQMLTGLRIDNQMIAAELMRLNYHFMPDVDKYHVPVVAPFVLDKPDHRFRVYCLACSELADEYVYPCKELASSELIVGPMPAAEILHIPPSLRSALGPLFNPERGGNRGTQDAGPDDAEPVPAQPGEAGV